MSHVVFCKCAQVWKMFSSGMSVEQEHVSICLLKLPLILIAAPGTLVSPAHQGTASFSCARVLLLSDLPDLPGTSAKLGRQPSAFSTLHMLPRPANAIHYTHGFGMPVLATYMHSCIHAYMRTCIHAYMHTCIHANMHTYIHTYIQTYIDA